MGDPAHWSRNCNVRSRPSLHDFGEIKLVFNLPPDKPVPDFAPTCNLAPSVPERPALAGALTGNAHSGCLNFLRKIQESKLAQ
jgi:hypothetical protein